MTFRSGEVVYTGRAFAQDAVIAMSGGLISALVELITNADDAYRDRAGSIDVTYATREACPEGVRAIVSVTDHATGLLPNDMERCFTHLGGETSGFADGEEVRGLFGRGAKDVATFGSAVFESIRYVQNEIPEYLKATGLLVGDPVYSRLELQRNGSWDMDYRKAKDLDFISLTTEVGDVVFRSQVVIMESATKSVTKPETLAEQIRRNALLRLLTQRRQVNMRVKKRATVENFGRLVYEIPPRTEILQRELDLGDFGTAKLTMHRLVSPTQEKVSLTTDCGILVSSGKSTFENTFFRRNEPELSWFQGHLDAPQIMELERVRQSLERQGSDTSAIGDPLFFRDRSGLNGATDLYSALKAAVDEVLDELITDERERSRGEGSAQLENDLKDAMQALNRELDDALREIDDELIRGALEGAEGEIIVIPKRKRITLGAKATLTVFTRRAAPSEGPSTVIAHMESGLRELIHIDVNPERRPHERWSYEVSRIVVEANELGSCVIGVVDTETGASTTAAIVVDIVSEIDREEPTQLRWKSPRMSVSPGNSRHAILEAPANDQGSLRVELRLEGEGIALPSNEVMLDLNDQGWLQGAVTVTGISNGTISRVLATAEIEECEAEFECRIPLNIGDPSTQVIINREIRSSAQGTLRTTDSGWELTIYARHQALSDLLGEIDPLTNRFVNEGRPEVRIRFAEAMTSAIVSFLISREWAARPDADEFSDPEAVMATRDARVSKWLPLIQRILLAQSSGTSF